GPGRRQAGRHRADPYRFRHDKRSDPYGEYASCGGRGRADPPAGGRATIGSIMSTSYAEPVLTWYARNARDLPWRAPDATPWAVLVSEILLQQTPVARVPPEYLSRKARGPPPA